MLSDPCNITRRFKFLVFDTLSLHCTILLYHKTQQTKTHSETLFKRWEKEELRNYTVGRTKVATFFPVSMRVSSPLFVSMKIEDGWPILKVVFSSGHDMVRNENLLFDTLNLISLKGWNDEYSVWCMILSVYEK